MPNSLQASVYGAFKHSLSAVKAAGTDETATVVAEMKATPVNDFMTPQRSHRGQWACAARRECLPCVNAGAVER